MIITLVTSLLFNPYLSITHPFHQNYGDHVNVVSTHSANQDNISTGSFANASVTLNYAPSPIYKTQILYAPRSMIVDYYRSGTLANVSVSVDGSFVSRLDIQTMRVVSAGVHQYHVSHLLSLIQSHASVDALRISSVHLDIIWMISLASVCLGLIIHPHLNAKFTI